MPEPTRDLRARILEALVTAPASFVRDSESAAAHLSLPWRRHDQHTYDGGCALCRGEADTLTDTVMAVIDGQQRAYEDLLGAVSLYVDWRYITRQLTTEQKTLWADARDAWAARMGHDEPSKAERWWAQ